MATPQKRARQRKRSIRRSPFAAAPNQPVRRPGSTFAASLLHVNPCWNLPKVERGVPDALSARPPTDAFHSQIDARHRRRFKPTRPEAGFHRCCFAASCEPLLEPAKVERGVPDALSGRPPTETFHSQIAPPPLQTNPSGGRVPPRGAEIGKPALSHWLPCTHTGFCLVKISRSGP